ncbi:response regulator [candidate division KSB1 bacterium]|nr:response regulator [candidate division KSB1 bacterium]
MKNNSGRKFLILEDDENVLEFLKFILEAQGDTVTEARTVQEGVSKIKTAVFDLVVCDVRLPDASGMDFIKQNKSQLGDTPVLMMTSFGSLQGVEQALKLGASAFISKPLRKEHFLKMVEYVLGGNSMSWDQIVSGENIYSYFPPPA